MFLRQHCASGHLHDDVIVQAACLQAKLCRQIIVVQDKDLEVSASGLVDPLQPEVNMQGLRLTCLQVVDRLSSASVVLQAQRTSAVNTVIDCALGRGIIHFVSVRPCSLAALI